MISVATFCDGSAIVLPYLIVFLTRMTPAKGICPGAARMRRRIQPLNRQRSTCRFIITLLLVCMAAGCGKRQPPLPPIERVQQRTELLSGVQRGNQVLLSWPAPLRNAPDSSVQSIRRIDVYRLAEKPTAPLPLTEEEFAARSTLIGSVPYAEIQKAGDELTYTDTLELAGQPTRLRYAVRYVNASGQ